MSRRGKILPLWFTPLIFVRLLLVVSLFSPVKDYLKVAITLDYRYQPPARRAY